MTLPSSWSSSPLLVTVKSMMEVRALISGVYEGLGSFVVRYSVKPVNTSTSLSPSFTCKKPERVTHETSASPSIYLHSNVQQKSQNKYLITCMCNKCKLNSQWETAVEVTSGISYVRLCNHSTMWFLFITYF